MDLLQIKDPGDEFVTSEEMLTTFTSLHEAKVLMVSTVKVTVERVKLFCCQLFCISAQPYW